MNQKLYKIQWRAQGAASFSDWEIHRYGPDRAKAMEVLSDLQRVTNGEGRVFEYDGEWPPKQKSIGHICFSTRGWEYYGHNLQIYEADFSLPVGADGIRPGHFYATKHGWRTYRAKGIKILHQREVEIPHGS